MQDIFMDVRLEIDADSLSREADPAQWVIEKARYEADKLCEQSGARLRTDRAPEIIVERGQHRLTGQLCVLVATRWAVIAPDTVPLGPPKG